MSLIRDGIQYAPTVRVTELLSRLGAAIGISFVLTLLLFVLYQDDSVQMPAGPASIAITQASAATAMGTP